MSTTSANKSQSSSDYVEIACQSCGATLLLQPHLVSTVCPYCASPSVIQRPPSKDLPRPTFVIGFAVDHERATALVKRWIGGRSMFARSDFKRAAPELTRGVYLPAYLYGAVSDSTFSAEIGENYTVTETYTTTDANGKTVVRTRTVTKTEWRTLRGNHQSYVMDVVVTASRGVSNAALEAIEPFDLRGPRRFSPSILAGWLAEEPSRTQDECFRLAHDETVAKVGGKLENFMPGDSHRNLRYQVQLSREVIDLVLFPVWSYAVRYDPDKPPVRILVNGQTGRVAGDTPISQWKIAAAVGVGLMLVLAFVLILALSQ
ncbi:hypothetical protein FYK55_24130 [Roseiconus nitratireducens]|uniref:Primosomal protein N' (Replication factor Y)-superfamily II helicase n=1 Tax=Roseiconus nitratireducens TaxID=2605748 RepID=A0A5M6CW16_9BACT|nr:hypothetical protein [Roseiconus nitratireducens]KAA5539427.1 hypothetical protein FYK55_24130 [Roseiconus nitratireducens]